MQAKERYAVSAFRWMRGGGLLRRHVAIAIATSAMVVVACGSSNQTAPLASATTAAPSSLAPASATPSASVAGYDVPTPEPLRSVRIPVVTCPTSFGLPDETLPPIPPTMTATVTPEVAALVTYYGDGTLTVLGPRDWHCAATVGVDASARMTIMPAGQSAPTGSTPPDEQAVTASTAGACIGCVASMACGLFPEARNLSVQPGLACPSTPPTGEQITRPIPRSAVFLDPPGVAGTGDPSGGRYRALGFLVFDPAKPAGGNGQTAPSALKVTCTLPDAMAQICDEIVEGIGRG